RAVVSRNFLTGGMIDPKKFIIGKEIKNIPNEIKRIYSTVSVRFMAISYPPIACSIEKIVLYIV
ncbi:MAG: hypothetical protein PWQ27_131, partial [Kosmotoga sp.]|nr:hypothetical protein [Kosmotoga sp.]